MTERFSASNAERLMNCPASANLEDLIIGFNRPAIDHDAGAKGKGSAIHEAFDATAGMTAKDLKHYIEALEYYASIKETRRFKELSEYTFTADWLQRKPKTTVDRLLYLSDELHVFDWKTGTIPVSAVGNHQMMFYAACAAQEFGLNAKGVTLHIVQPWADNIEDWFVTTTQLKDFVQETIETEQKILAKDSTFMPGSHCKFCVANPHYRGKQSEKGTPSCPTMTHLLYPRIEVDDEEVLGS